MADLLHTELPAKTLVVAIDPGKVANRVWLTSGERGLICEPISLPVLREGVDELERLIASSGVEGRPIIGLEATGSLHTAWATELEYRFPGSLRLFAPSESQAARSQLGSRRIKADDRDCAALVWLLRQGAGRPAGDGALDALRAARLARDLERHRSLQTDIVLAEDQLAELLPQTDGQVLTTLPGVACVRAAGFAAHSLPIARFPTPDHLFSATGLAPATYQSATLRRRGRISRQGLPEHRDALMSIAWGLAQHGHSFAERDRELRARGMQPIQARVALARHACRLAYALLRSQQPFDEARYRRTRHRRGR